MVKSEPGNGSTFTVSLPMPRGKETKEPIPVVEDANQIPAAGTESNCVLLVEDYPANVMIATWYLEQFGYTHDLASNGAEAVQKAKNGHYAAILMDVQMHGMNGFEATQQIRDHESAEGLPRTPIIGMTAHALAGYRERCLEAGMDDYISKPFKPEELEDKLRQAIPPQP